ncbi:hypothetical protein ACS0TY_028182 [Phlomoides rotata]
MSHNHQLINTKTSSKTSNKMTKDHHRNGRYIELKSSSKSSQSHSPISSQPLFVVVAVVVAVFVAAAIAVVAVAQGFYATTITSAPLRISPPTPSPPFSSSGAQPNAVAASLRLPWSDRPPQPDAPPSATAPCLQPTHARRRHRVFSASRIRYQLSTGVSRIPFSGSIKGVSSCQGFEQRMDAFWFRKWVLHLGFFKNSVVPQIRVLTKVSHSFQEMHILFKRK